MSEGNGHDIEPYPPTIIDSRTGQPYRNDSWFNQLTGAGTDRDKLTAARLKVPMTSNSFQEFENLYHGEWSAKKTVDAPAHEMVRKWFKVNIDDTVQKKPSDERSRLALAEESEVAKKVDVSALMNKFLKDLRAPLMTQEGIVWGKVFGGSLMLLGADDGQDLEEPLNEDNISTFTHLTVFDRWEISVRKWYNDPSLPNFGSPEVYEITQSTVPGGVILPTAKKPSTQALIHETRFLRFEGGNTNRRRRIRQNGWADSVYIPMFDVIRDFGTTWSSASHLMADFAQAVFKLKGLGAMLKSDTEGLVIKRLMMMDAARSTARMIPIDAEHEDFVRQATPLTGLPDMLELFIIRFAAAARMPVSVLFGVTLKAGMNQSGASDLSIWREQISSQQEAFLRPHMEKLVRLSFKSKDGPTAGKEPESWSLEFNPLEDLNEGEESKSRLNTAQSDVLMLDRGVVSPEEIAQSRYGGDAYSSETMLDTQQRAEDRLADEEQQRIVGDVTPEELEEFRQFKANQVAPLPPALKAQQANPGDPPPVPGVPKEDRFDVVKKEGSKYVVRSKDGKKLGEHNTEVAANKQLRAIEASKKRDAIEPRSELEPNDHIHRDPEGGTTGGIIDAGLGVGPGGRSVPVHVHKRPDGLGNTQPAPTGVLHIHGTDQGTTGKNIDMFNFDFDREDAAHPDDGDGICDRNSPNYNAAKCAARKKG